MPNILCSIYNNNLCKRKRIIKIDSFHLNETLSYLSKGS